MQVAKWGNSLAVRLPAALVDELGLKEGDNIDLRPVGKDEFVVEKSTTIEESFDAIRALRRPFPPDWKLDRDDPDLGRE
jgi:antitoxin MazE